MMGPAIKVFFMSRILNLVVTFLLSFSFLPHASAQQNLCENPLVVTIGPDTLEVGDVAVLAKQARLDTTFICINISTGGTYLIETEIRYSRAQQKNESFYLEICDSTTTACIDPCDPNSGSKKIVQEILEDTGEADTIKIRKAGHFFLAPGNYVITLNHYKKWVQISGDSTFINDGRIGPFESVHLQKLILTQISERFDCPRNYDLDLTKTVRPQSVFAGQAFTYSLSIFNRGPGNANNFTITDVLSDSVFPSEFLANPPTEQSGQILKWKSVTVDSGETYAIEFTATFPDSFEIRADSLRMLNTSFVAAAMDTNAKNDTASAIVFIKPPVYDLELEKGINKSSAVPGETFTYSIQIRNRGPGKASNIRLTDVLADSIEPGDFLNNDLPIDPTSRTLEWQLAPLDSGQIKEIKFTAIFPESFTVERDSLEKINSSFVDAEFDSNPENDSSSAIIFIKPIVYDLELMKHVTPSSVLPGETFTYSLHIYNNGPGRARNTELTDILPDSIQPVDFLSNDLPIDPKARTLEWRLAPLDSGQTKEIKFTAVFPKAFEVTGDSLQRINSSSIKTEFDINPQNDTDTATVYITPPPPVYDLKLTKSVAPTRVFQGQEFKYTLEVFNNGPDDTDGFSIWDAVPAGVRLSGFSVQPSDPLASDTLHWTIDSVLAPGASTEITYSGLCPTIPGSQDTLIRTNLANVFSENDSIPENNADTTTVVCLPPPTLCEDLVFLDRSVFKPDAQEPLKIIVDLGFFTDVSLDIFDITGYPIRNISTENATIGRNTFSWDGLTSDGLKAGSGVYIIIARDKSSKGKTLECIQKVLVVR